MPNYIENLLYLGAGLAIAAVVCITILFVLAITAQEIGEDGESRD